MADAFCTVLQGLDITYINLPASFETAGERVQLPDRIVASRMEAGLDLPI